MAIREVLVIAGSRHGSTEFLEDMLAVCEAFDKATEAIRKLERTVETLEEIMGCMSSGDADSTTEAVRAEVKKYLNEQPKQHDRHGMVLN